MTHEPILLSQTETVADAGAQALHVLAPFSRQLMLPARSLGVEDRHGPTIDVVLRLSKHPTVDAADKAGREASVERNDSTPVINVRVHELALHTIQRMTCGDAVAPRRLTSTDAEAFGLAALSKALGAAGIKSSMLDRDADGAVRLALIAILLDVHRPAAQGPDRKRGPGALPKWRLRRVLDYIERNISEPISLGDLATVAGLSRMYFASQFRAATGMRPHDCILNKRIAHAQKLLVTTTDSLVEIALSVGFQTQAHFTTIFKKLVGETPNCWRKRQRIPDLGDFA
jgi:AraC-like DNA-binding protein